jgi:hypothetical protein
MSLTLSIFVPTINFFPHITKPLIPFLLIKASCDLFGENELAVRLPSAIVALLTVISFYYLARKLFEERYRWFKENKFKTLASDERWLFLSNLTVFLIFTLAKARRGYYILPILPFAVLLMITFLRNIQSNSWIITGKLLKNIYKVLSYLFILLLFISPLFIKLYRYELKLPFFGFIPCSFIPFFVCNIKLK